jgi:hypothetical protein
MPWVGFESTIPVFARAKTVHASDSAATVIGDSVAWSYFWRCHYYVQRMSHKMLYKYIVTYMVTSLIIVTWGRCGSKMPRLSHENALALPSRCWGIYGKSSSMRDGNRAEIWRFLLWPYYTSTHKTKMRKTRSDFDKHNPCRDVIPVALPPYYLVPWLKFFTIREHTDHLAVKCVQPCLDSSIDRLI